jgi:hypothetical protein
MWSVKLSFWFDQSVLHTLLLALVNLLQVSLAAFEVRLLLQS